ncbi:DNA polymerase III subunit gamma/tau [Halomonas organivorans]|uniref:DNA polymerase III subunit gamma/tau n=1 Tax=Halomonas organivorans TaxID=257772 RepID=A0A7W5BVZ8_9GAMM|nr:DNA polymerase III subunit gamma/tau [Halomonas organivorans]MBB3140172.1 DNA polymerase-3 subunit gamma/tau [Halomonas organivorans]
MSYQVLARKWRPRTFHELVGQEHVQRALVNALDQGRLHHAYLFTGTRGVGKTTLARILAKCLNCTAGGRGDEGVTSTPCGQCPSCEAIDEGRFVDLIEVDAASRTKVEDTRELLDNVQYAPTQGRYKVYLIDEVHMLSTSSFNALLKTLEEPPPHVKFLLATTDPQKLPPTVLSRCLQFTLKHMPPERIVGHLSQVLEAEGVSFEESALWLLGKAAEGSMRDAMSLTDQAIAFGQGAVRHADVAAMLGTLDHRHVLALLEALAEVDAARVLAEVAALAEQGPDFAGVLDDVTGVLHRLAVAQMVPDALDNGHGDREMLLALAARFTAEDIQLYYQIGIQGRGDMAHAPDLRTALEMTLLRMLAFRPQGVPKPAQTPLPMRGDGGAPAAGGGAGQPGGSDQAASVAAAPSGAPAAATAQAAAPGAAAPQPMAEPAPASEASAPQPGLAPEPAPVPVDVAETSEPAGQPQPVPEPPLWIEDAAQDVPVQDVPVQDVPAQEAPAPAAPAPEPSPETASPEPATSESAAPEPQPEPAPEPAPVEAPASHAAPEPAEAPATATAAEATAGELSHAVWLERFDSLGLSGLTRNLAAHCVVEADDGMALALRLDPSQAAMQAEVHVERIRQALAAAGFERRLTIADGPLPADIETPRQRADRLAAERHAEAVAALQADPQVQKLQQAFGARLIETTVKPAEAAERR